MPHLDERLKCVARQIRCKVHVDIGSDHGHLLKALLMAGRTQRGIAIENKQQPFNNSAATLAGLPADVRLADGLLGLMPNEAESLSICGMGADSMLRILSACPDRIPPSVVLQPNGRAERLREWGLQTGFHLLDEQIVFGKRCYDVLRFNRVNDEAQHDDPAYAEVDRETAIVLGPHHIVRRDPAFIEKITADQVYLRGLSGNSERTRRRLSAIDRVLSIS